MQPRIFQAYALAFGGAALYHLLCVLLPAWSTGASPARHALFVLVNLGLALGMLKRPKGFAWLLLLLCVQQLWSHGNDLWQAWQKEQRFDGLSALVVVAMPLIYWTVQLDARRARDTNRRA